MLLDLITVGLAGLLFVGSAIAQSEETIHAAVILTRHGEQTPIILEADSILTPLGAQQLYSAGSYFRNRYVNPTSSNQPGAITGIDTYVIDNDQIVTFALSDEPIATSAIAFLQGLYPPTNQSSSSLILEDENVLANGTVSLGPLGGYQYPQIQTFGPLDPNVIWMAGSANCPEAELSASDYFTTAESETSQLVNAEFYSNIINETLGNASSPDKGTYINAYAIYDYVLYQHSHNRTLNLSSADVNHLRALAGQEQWGINGNLSASGRTQGDRIRAIAGQTLAAKVLSLLTSNIRNQGIYYKMNLMFSYLDPFVAFAALAELQDQNTDFMGIPNFGSSMVFELFSIGNNTAIANYPSTDNLKVRFYFRNGTDEDMVSYALFDRPKSQSDMSWNDFVNAMQGFYLNDLGQWCDTCQSQNYYCELFSADFNNGTSGGEEGDSGMTHQIAGVIGASVTIGVFLLLIAAAMLFGGVRFHRVTKRKSELGGFKGSEKLASDADLTSGKAAEPVAGASVTKGHERVGSWELREQAGQRKLAEENFGSLRRPESLRDDDDELRVNPFSDPVKVREHV